MCSALSSAECANLTAGMFWMHSHASTAETAFIYRAPPIYRGSAAESGPNIVTTKYQKLLQLHDVIPGAAVSDTTAAESVPSPNTASTATLASRS